MTPNVPLLLLPGLMNDERVWSPLLPVIGAGRHVQIAPTHLHGRLEDTAREALASMPPGRFAIAGFSLGGYVALEVCRQAMGRIAGLALLDTAARVDAEESRQTRIRMMQAMTTGAASLDQMAAGFASRVVHSAHLDDLNLLRLLADMARSVGREGFVRQQQAAMGRRDSRALLQEIRAPTLVLCGREDQITPCALSEEMAGLLPNAELVIVETAGHMSTLEQPQAVSAAVAAWLSRVDGPLA